MSSAAQAGGAFRHEALFYAGDDDFAVRTLPFIVEAVEAEEPILVVVNASKIERLRQGLGDRAGAVLFADMADVGANPGRIIPAWRAFVSDQAGSGRRFRGIGEPIWATRSQVELTECQRHETLLNLAFADSPAWTLLCPYDTAALPSDVIQEAQRSHPFLRAAGAERASSTYRGLDAVSAAVLQAPLPDPAKESIEIMFGASALFGTRQLVSDYAESTGLSAERAVNLVLAVNELLANTLRHGGGRGRLRMWSDPGTVVCEVRDQGRIERPLVDRERPTAPGDARGLWLATQLCDLVQLRSSAAGTAVRLHMNRD